MSQWRSTHRYSLTRAAPIYKAKLKRASFFGWQLERMVSSNFQAKAVECHGVTPAVPGFNHSRSTSSQGHYKDFLIRLLLCLETWRRRACRGQSVATIAKIRVRPVLLLNLGLASEGLNNNSTSHKMTMMERGCSGILRVT